MSFLYQPPQRERKIRTIERPISNPKRENALEHVTKGWFPINPELLALVRRKVEHNTYANEPEQLLQDLKSDPALFCHFVKQLPVVLDNRTSRTNPLEALRQVSSENLNELLKFSEGESSLHTFENATRLQARRLQFTLLSSHAAERIAGDVELNGELAFVTSVFRQLGLDLIAWNYPSIYAKVMGAHRKRGVQPEFEFQKIIGISPSQLGMKFAEDWGLSPEFVNSLWNKKSPLPAEEESDEQGQMTVSELCEITELYAKSRDPEGYPSAEALWRAREASLRDRIDTSAFDEVATNVANTMLVLGGQVRTIQEAPLVAPDHGGRRRALENPLAAKNPYLHECPLRVRELLERMYEDLYRNRVSIEAIRLLAEEVAPTAGFARGCLFLLDQETHLMRPVLRFGERKLSDYQTIINDPDTGVSDALHSTAPMKKVGRGVGGDRVPQICGSLRNYMHPGVLYLEILPEANDNPEFNPLAYFHAIRQAINHCFGADRD